MLYIYVFSVSYFLHELYLKIFTLSQVEFSFNTYFSQACTTVNQKLLQMLDVSYCHLHKICAMAKKYGLSGKYTDLANGRYAYIWCPLNKNIDTASYINELNTHGIDVIQTYLFCTGVKID